MVTFCSDFSFDRGTNFGSPHKCTQLLEKKQADETDQHFIELAQEIGEWIVKLFPPNRGLTMRFSGRAVRNLMYSWKSTGLVMKWPGRRKNRAGREIKINLTSSQFNQTR